MTGQKPADRNQIFYIRVMLWGLVVLALLALAWFTLVSPRLDRLQTQAGPADLGHGEYQLAGTDGTPFTEASLKGEPSAVFFGFTHCPDVCPTTLGDILTWQEDLATEGKKLRVFFVTVDPERDTADVLREYVSWVPGVTGVTGSAEETAKALKAFRIFARKVPQDDGGYTMDHSAMVLLFDAEGNYAGIIGYQQDPARTKDSLDKLLG